MIVKVESETTPGLFYEVNLIERTCTCPSFNKNKGKECKHIKKLISQLNGNSNPNSRFKMKTKNGYNLDEVVSALQKSIRRGLEEDAMYWALEMVDSGYIRYMWRRLLVIASEDIGPADPQTVILISSLYVAYEAVSHIN